MKFFPGIKIGNEQYPALTGVRWLGAMAVFFIHFPFHTRFTFSVPGINPVVFFFVLSGFLITYLYYGKADQVFSRGSIQKGGLYDYLIKRFARIYPVYFLMVTIAIICRHNFSFVFLVKNYTLTHSLFHDRSARAIEQSWSLTVEECFYLLAPIFMYLIRKFSFRVFLLSGFFLLGLALLVSKMNAPYLFLESPNFIFSVTFFGHFFEFFAGIFLALCVLRLEKNNQLSRKGYKWTLAGGLGSVAVISIPAILQYLDKWGGWEMYTVVNNFLLPPFIAVFYFGLIGETTWISKLLSLKPLGWLGRASYAFYLVHMLVIEQIAIPLLLPMFRKHYNLYVFIVFLLTLLIALLVFVLYEEPLNLFIRKRFGRKRKGTVAVT